MARHSGRIIPITTQRRRGSGRSRVVPLSVRTLRQRPQAKRKPGPSPDRRHTNWMAMIVLGLVAAVFLLHRLAAPARIPYAVRYSRTIANPDARYAFTDSGEDPARSYSYAYHPIPTRPAPAIHGTVPSRDAD